MTTWFLFGAMAVTVLVIACALWRALLGPTTVDRVLAYDALCLAGVALLLLVFQYWQTDLFLDLVLIFAMIGFFSTTALVIFLENQCHRPEEEEPLGPLPESTEEEVRRE